MAKKTPETTYVKSVIHIETTPTGQLKVDTTNITFETALRMLLPTVVSCAKKVEEAAEATKTLNKVQFETLRTTIYDTMNIAFSNALTLYAPDIEARPDLTEDAILKAQNDLLEAEMKARGYLTEDGQKNPAHPSSQLEGQISIEDIIKNGGKSE